MSDADRPRTTTVGHASHEVTPATQPRVVAYWMAIDADLGARVASGLGIVAGTTNGDLASAREEVFAHANHA